MLRLICFRFGSAHFCPFTFFLSTRCLALCTVPRAVVTVGWQSSSMHSVMPMSFESLPLVDDAHADVQVGAMLGTGVFLFFFPFFQCSTIEFHRHS